MGQVSRSMQSSITLPIFLLCFTLASSGGIHNFLARYGHDSDLSAFMDLLDTLYTPQCLKVLISDYRSYSNINDTTSTKMDDINSNISVNSFKNSININKSKPQIHIQLFEDTLHQVENTFHYMIRHPEKLTPFSCVTYLLSKPPDSRLISLLTLTYSSKRLTHYFLVYSESTTKAEQVLLDPKLSKVENVAALVQEESPKKSYWRVLIRQLLHPSGSPQVLTVSRWSRDTGLTSTENIFPEQMANFYGRKLFGSTLNYIPFVDAEKTKGSDILKLKPCVDKVIIETLAQHLNFTYEIYMPPDRQWGYLKDGHFTGMLGEVESGRANFTFDLFVTLERMMLVDFTRTYLVDSLSFITAKVRQDPRWRKLITPFRGTVWACVIASFGVGALLYQLIDLAQTSLAFPSSRTSSSPAFMRVLASFLCQSLHQYLRLQSGRVFLGFWFMYAFLVTTFATTFLTSTLAVPFAPSTIDTLQVLEDSGLTYGMHEQKGNEYDYFVTTQVPLYRKMFKEMTFYSTKANLQRVSEGSHAFLYFKSHIDLLVAIHNSNPGRRSDLHVAAGEFYTMGVGCVITKGAPYRRTFDAVMKKCLWGGLINKWLQDFYVYFAKTTDHGASEESGRGEQVASRNSNEVVFNLNHLQGPFLMLCLGGVGGTLLLLLECLVARTYSNH